MRTLKMLIVVGIAVTAGAIESKADLLRLKLDRIAAGADPSVFIQHKAGAAEGLDGFDSPHLSLGGDIDYYSSSYTPLDLNAMPADSFTRVTNVVVGVNMPSPVAFNLVTSIITENGEFNGKILNLDIYTISNGVPSLQGSYNARTTTTGNPAPLTVSTGHSYNIVFRPEPSNAVPSAIDTTNFGPKDAVLNGWFSVSDTDGIVTNVSALNSPTGFTPTGTNWSYSPQGFIGTNIVSFYAVDNLGAVSTTNLLTLITTNNPNLNQAVITNITILSGTATLDALASPGYEHVLLSSTNLGGFGPVATNVIPFFGTNNMQATSFSLPAASGATFYRLLSR